MTVALLSLDETISDALRRPRLSDRLGIILEAIADHPTVRTNRRERLDDMIIYALGEAERRGRAFDGILIEQIIFNFLEEFDDR
jgi:hypothetical protein